MLINYQSIIVFKSVDELGFALLFSKEDVGFDLFVLSLLS